MSLGACDVPDGLIRIHFGLHAEESLHLDLPNDTPAPVDLVLVDRAEGSLEISVLEPHLMSSFRSLPPPTDSAWVYRLWVSDEEAHAETEAAHGHEHDGDHEAWARVTRLRPDEAGRAEGHAAQSQVEIPLESVRQAMVTLQLEEDAEPTEAVVLHGGVGLDPEEIADVEAAPQTGGHQH